MVWFLVSVTMKSVRFLFPSIQTHLTSTARLPSFDRRTMVLKPSSIRMSGKIRRLPFWVF